MPQQKLILNLVDQVSQVNFGIWHAAIASAESLQKDHGIRSVLVAPEPEFPFPKDEFPFVQFVPVSDLTQKGAKDFLKDFDPTTTSVATHGCWQFPTKWGSISKRLGFRWIYTPHGMLEPWSMSQKWLKKKVYFELLEKRLAKMADLVRAVGQPELENLKIEFNHSILIPNAVYERDLIENEQDKNPIQILFLARLHHKKGVIPMVEAWMRSKLWLNPDYRLAIAGTDDGEQRKLEEFLTLKSDSNIVFEGPAFGIEKHKLLTSSRYYILPSVSEGFPTSVVEAMAAGLIPIITEGCNFPEAFANQLAIKTTQKIDDLILAFNQLPEMQEQEVSFLSAKCREFVKANYLWSKIADIQAKTYFQTT